MNNTKPITIKPITTKSTIAKSTIAKPITARELSQELEGTLEQRLNGKRTIYLTMSPGKRPEVVFTGFWNNKFIKGAQASIARAYRMTKHRPRKFNIEKKEEAKNGRTE